MPSRVFRRSVGVGITGSGHAAGGRRRSRRLAMLLTVTLVGAVVVAVPATASSGITERVSVASDGTQGNATSAWASVSADGGHVVFQSGASNLVAGDTNGTSDVFVHDRATGTTERVSVASDGTQGNGPSVAPSVSADGRYVAYQSLASNLVAGDNNDIWDVFVHDRATGTTERVSVASDGTQGNGPSVAPSVSADGRYVAFNSDALTLVAGDTNSWSDVFVHDRATGTTERVSVASDGTQGNGVSFGPSISADGGHVAFESLASTLVAGDTNGAHDVFVRDRATGTTERVSVASDGTQGNGESLGASVSADGGHVVFHSGASTLVAGDTNNRGDVFVHGAPLNEPPAVQAGADAAGDEGSAITLDGTVTDSDGDTLTTMWSYTAEAGVDTGATCSFGDASLLNTTITCTDNGTYTVTLTANDGTNPDVIDSATVTVGNAAPSVGSISAPVDPVAVNTAVNVSASFTDPGANDSHTCEVDWGDASGNSAGTVADGACTAGHTYTAAGIYTLTVTVTDDDGGSRAKTHEYVVVYDPSAGYVTGGGWIDSPQGAYTVQPSAEGRANFAFVSGYKKGATVPEGRTSFRFVAGGMSFESNSYQWLVVSGPKAQYKGTGDLNGVPGFSFLLTATDGDAPGGGGFDKFRIKIWETVTEAVVYDNVQGASDDLVGANPQEIGGGQIMIHTD